MLDMQLLVRTIRFEASGVTSFELVDPLGAPLPEFEAGSHIDVEVQAGVLRQYSLCNSPAERNRYLIAVAMARNGRGGSLAMHSNVRVGSMIGVSTPRNHFGLIEAKRHVLIAGGIGITPILAMAEELAAQGKTFDVVYCAQSRTRAAFVDRILALTDGRARVHFDEGDAHQRFDFAELLAVPAQDTHLYCCGPAPMMDAVRTAACHWPHHQIHFEAFAKATPTGDKGEDDVFTVGFTNSSLQLEVPCGKSILAVLREHGIERASSCESGFCGACKTRYVSGHPIHRDSIQSDDEKQQFVMICCARSRDRLVLDLEAP